MSSPSGNVQCSLSECSISLNFMEAYDVALNPVRLEAETCI
jgi:hypothetical protein